MATPNLIGNTITSVNVYNGGGNFNVPTGATNTVSANLLATTGNGVYAQSSGGSFAVTGGAAVIGAPYVAVTGGSGTGAAAIATVSNGVISGVTMTNPGQGYQAGDTLTYYFGYGASNYTTYQHTLTAGDIAPNAGVVNKTGGGTLTLSGSNTYTGGTTVSAGTLAIHASTALGTGPVTLKGGTLALTGSSNPVYLVNAPGSGASVNGTSVVLTPSSSSAGAAFTNIPIAISDTGGFTFSFTYTPTPIPTSGYQYGGASFIIGKTTAYGGGTFANSSNTQSVEIDNEIYWNSNDAGAVAGMYTAFSTDGAAPTAANVNPYAFNTWRADPINVTVTYAGGILSETLVDTTPTTGQATQQYAGPDSGQQNTSPVTFNYPVDIAQVLGGSANGSTTAYVGFTGVSNPYSSVQTISNFSQGTTVAVGSLVPVSLVNGVIAAANTSSILQVGTSTGASVENIPSLTLQNGSSLALTQAVGSTGRLVLATPSFSIAQNSSGAFTAKLDIQSGGLDLPGATLSSVNAMVAQGYGGGNWQGSGGILSTTAAQDPTHLTAIGVIVNDDGSGNTALYGTNGTIGTSFDGASPADGDILVKYTYYGDANLNGTVDGADYTRIDGAWLNNQNTSSPALTGWFNGDFNYDGVVNGSDYTLIDNAFNMQSAGIAAEVAGSTAQLAGEIGTSAVPEPTSLTLLALGAVGLLGRRRRRSN